jgi:hypothetical protein
MDNLQCQLRGVRHCGRNHRKRRLRFFAISYTIETQFQAGTRQGFGIRKAFLSSGSITAHPEVTQNGCSPGWPQPYRDVC